MRLQALILGSLSCVLVLSCAGPAENAASGPAPHVSNGLVGPRLIAWTYFQKPQPLPQQNPTPVPLPDPQAEQQPAEQGAAQVPTAPSQPELGSHTLSGTIVREGGVYVLKVSDTGLYQLDDQEMARPFENTQVKVVGTLQEGSNMVHVVSIEPVS